MDSIEHGPLVDGALLEEMAARGTLWVPTVATITAYVGVLPQWRESLPLAAELGVRVLAGSDELPAGSLHREVEALAACGLPPAVALRRRRRPPARRSICRPIPETSSYAADPRIDPTTLREPVAVVAGGRRVH